MHFLCKLLIILLLSHNFVFAQVNIIKKPTFFSADFIEYNTEEDFIYAKGNIKITLDNYEILADRLLYDMKNDLLLAQDNIRIKDEKKNIIFGETLFLQSKLKIGVIADFILKFGDNSVLVSRLAERVSENQTNLYNASFTPCQISSVCKPIWQLSAQKTFVDLDKQKITYKNLFFELYGIPIFYTPYFSHPSPGAKAASGILVPEIKENKLGIPLYLRAQPNVDFTFTPRISNKYSIFELEARHKINNGQYIIQGSYGKVPYTIKNANKIIKNTNVASYFISSQGDFYKKHFKYGFNFNRTSDKAYLKNYYSRFDPYLTSSLYLNKVKNYNYLSLEGLYFQDLRGDDLNDFDSLIFPRIRTKNVVSLNEDESTHFIIENNTLIYNKREEKQLGRTSFQLSVTNNSSTASGHLFNLTAKTREDLYLVSYLDQSQPNKALIRSIPEFQTTWRYPLLNNISSRSSISIEPIAVSTIGRKFQPKDQKFQLIDSPIYEPSEDNIFLSNRYSGMDYHEFGNRLSYGINSGLLFGQNHLNLFLGHLIHKYNTKTTYSQDNIGKVQVSFSDIIELFYRFRKDKHFSSIRDEAGANFLNKKFQLTTSFIQLRNMHKYYAIENFAFSQDRARQVSYDFSYQLTPNWIIGNDMRIDISSKKARIFYRSIKVTYIKDCVSITGKFSNDYMSDYTRGIRKVNSSTVSVGLKVLNM